MCLSLSLSKYLIVLYVQHGFAGQGSVSHPGQDGAELCKISSRCSKLHVFLKLTNWLSPGFFV